jgi:hypothetical protein
MVGMRLPFVEGRRRHDVVLGEPARPAEARGIGVPLLRLLLLVVVRWAGPADVTPTAAD